MKGINGFTLIEVLFTLFIVSIVSVLFIPNMLQVIERQQTKHFFEIFNSDILMIQNKSIGEERNIRIRLRTDHYLIMDERELIVQREYPKHLTYIEGSNNIITFNNTGTMMNPRTFHFRERNKAYLVVFPLGKGRHYIEEM